MKKSKNYYKKQKIITINIDRLSPNIISFFDGLAKLNKRTDFVIDALNHWYFYTTDFQKCMTQIIELNYGLVKHLLRKVGRKNRDRIDKYHKI